MNLLVTDVTVGDRPGRAVQVLDGRIAWLGDAADAPSANRVVTGEGALLTPAFVDAHVHATASGSVASAITTRSARPEAVSAAASASLRTRPVSSAAPAARAAASDRQPDFPAAALGAEGMAADVTMLVGNGYTPGHAHLALELYRSNPGVRGLIGSRIR